MHSDKRYFENAWHTQINHGYTSTVSKLLMLEQHKRVKDGKSSLSETPGRSETFEERFKANQAKSVSASTRLSLRSGLEVRRPGNAAVQCWALMISSSSQVSPASLILCLRCNTQSLSSKQMSRINALSASSLHTSVRHSAVFTIAPCAKLQTTPKPKAEILVHFNWPCMNTSSTGVT